MILWAVIGLTIGIALGEFHGRRSAGHTLTEGTLYWVIPESVNEFDALAHGETNTAKTICGQRVWSFLDLYDRSFAGGTAPAGFIKSLPEARRIVGVISNEDRRAMIATDPQEAAF